MKRILVILSLMALALFANGQAQVEFGSGVLYGTGDPAYTPSTYGSRLYMDLDNSNIWKYDVGTAMWILIGSGGGGGDNWGTQVAITDFGITGNGTALNPLEVDTTQIPTFFDLDPKLDSVRLQVVNGNILNLYVDGNLISSDTLNLGDTADQDSIIRFEILPACVFEIELQSGVIHRDTLDPVICAGGGGDGIDLDSIVSVTIENGILCITDVATNQHCDTINSLWDELRLFWLEDYQGETKIIGPSDTIRILNGLEIDTTNGFEIGLGGELNKNTNINALDNTFTFNQIAKAYLQSNRFASTLFPVFPADSVSWRFWSLGGETNRSVAGVSEGMAAMFSINGNTLDKNGFEADPDGAVIHGDDGVKYRADNGGGSINVQQTMLPVDNTVPYVIGLGPDSNLTRVLKSTLGGSASLDSISWIRSYSQPTSSQFWVFPNDSLNLDNYRILTDSAFISVGWVSRIDGSFFPNPPVEYIKTGQSNASPCSLGKSLNPIPGLFVRDSFNLSWQVANKNPSDSYLTSGSSAYTTAVNLQKYLQCHVFIVYDYRGASGLEYWLRDSPVGGEVYVRIVDTIVPPSGLLSIPDTRTYYQHWSGEGDKDRSNADFRFDALRYVDTIRQDFGAKTRILYTQLWSYFDIDNRDEKSQVLQEIATLGIDPDLGFVSAEGMRIGNGDNLHFGCDEKYYVGVRAADWFAHQITQPRLAHKVQVVENDTVLLNFKDQGTFYIKSTNDTSNLVFWDPQNGARYRIKHQIPGDSLLVNLKCLAWEGGDTTDIIPFYSYVLDDNLDGYWIFPDKAEILLEYNDEKFTIITDHTAQVISTGTAGSAAVPLDTLSFDISPLPAGITESPASVYTNDDLGATNDYALSDQYIAAADTGSVIFRVAGPTNTDAYMSLDDQAVIQSGNSALYALGVEIISGNYRLSHSRPDNGNYLELTGTNMSIPTGSVPPEFLIRIHKNLVDSLKLQYNTGSGWVNTATQPYGTFSGDLYIGIHHNFDSKVISYPTCTNCGVRSSGSVGSQKRAWFKNLAHDIPTNTDTSHWVRSNGALSPQVDADTIKGNLIHFSNNGNLVGELAGWLLYDYARPIIQTITGSVSFGELSGAGTGFEAGFLGANNTNLFQWYSNGNDIHYFKINETSTGIISAQRDTGVFRVEQGTGHLWYYLSPNDSLDLTNITGGSSLFTNDGSTTYLTETTDQVSIGADYVTNSKLEIRGRDTLIKAVGETAGYGAFMVTAVPAGIEISDTTGNIFRINANQQSFEFVDATGAQIAEFDISGNGGVARFEGSLALKNLELDATLSPVTTSLVSTAGGKVSCYATGGNDITINLGPVSISNDAVYFLVIEAADATSTIILDPNASEQINNSTTFTIDSDTQRVYLLTESNGKWWIH